MRSGNSRGLLFMLLYFLLLTIPWGERPTGMSEERLPNVNEADLSSIMVGSWRWIWRFPLKLRLFPALGNAVSRQPATIGSFGVGLQRAALTKVMSFLGQLTSKDCSPHGCESPTTRAECQTTLKGCLSTRFPNGIDQGFFEPAMWFSLTPPSSQSFFLSYSFQKH